MSSQLGLCYSVADAYAIELSLVSTTFSSPLTIQPGPDDCLGIITVTYTKSFTTPSTRPTYSTLTATVTVQTQAAPAETSVPVCRPVAVGSPSSAICLMTGS